MLSGLPKFHRGALALFLLTVAGTALVGDQPLGDALRLQPGALLSGAGLWQPLTANFVFPVDSVGLILGSLFMQWFIGSRLEGFWGTRKYVTLVLGCGFAGYLVYALLSPWLPAVVHGGSTAVDLAAVTAFGVVYGRQELSLVGAVTLRGRTLAMILIALGVLGPLARGAPWPLVIPWLVGVAGAYLVTAQPWKRRDANGGGRGGGGRGGSNRPAKPRERAKPSHLRVVKDGLPN